jgi:hypothetical protein
MPSTGTMVWGRGVPEKRNKTSRLLQIIDMGRIR